MVKIKLPRIFKPSKPEPPTQPATVTRAATAPSRKIPRGFEPIERYPLYDPFAHAIIAQNEETGEIIYVVDELPLLPREQKIYNMIVETLQWELKPQEEVEEDPREYFKREARRVIHQYRISLGKLAGISWSKILYYVERDIIGYGKIDPLMRDPNIEDISCDGVAKPVFIWHRKYENIATNIRFESDEELDEFIMRMAHLAGKHISLPPWEKVLVVDEDSVPKLVEIGEFVDNIINTLGSFYRDGAEVAVTTGLGYRVYSLNTSTGEVELSEISHVIRHRVDGDIVEVEGEAGAKVEVTGDHSVYVLRGGELKLISAHEVRKGDYLVSPLKLHGNAETCTLLASETYRHRDGGDVEPLKDIIGAPAPWSPMGIARAQHVLRAVTESEDLGVPVELIERYLGDRIWKLRHRRRIRRGNVLKKISQILSVIEDIERSGTLEDYKPWMSHILSLLTSKGYAVRISRKKYRLTQKGHTFKHELIWLRNVLAHLAFYRVRRVKKRRYSGYVYDLSVPVNENFTAGTLQVIVSNSSAFPILDTMLPGMHRLAATFRREVSTQGSTFTIRKFREEPFSIIDLLKFRTIDPTTAAYLWLAMENKMTTFIMGVTGSGKTSTLNALATMFHPSIKIVTIEDTPELRLPMENWVQLVSRPSYGIGPEKIGEITLYDLVKVSLRYRPDIIIVGEVRGEEAYVLFQAIASVSWDTPVLIRDSNGRVRLIEIGRLVDRFYEEGEERIAKPVSGLEVLSHDGYRAVWKPIKYVLRHSTDSIYRVKVEGGAEIKATGSHSVFVIDPETLEVVEKPVKDLRPGDLLVTFTSHTLSSSKSHAGIHTAAQQRVALAVGGNGNQSVFEASNIHDTLAFRLGTRIVSGTLEVDRRRVRGILDLMWHAPYSSVEAFFKGLGTGSLQHTSGRVEYSTRSKRLAWELAWLARLNGLYSEVQIEEENPQRRYKVRVVIKGDNNPTAVAERVPAAPLVKLSEMAKCTFLASELSKAESLRYISRAQARRILEAIAREGRIEGEAARLYRRIKSYVEGELKAVEVLEVKQEKYSGYVYDLSVPETESFFGGNLPILLHNTGHGGLSTIHAESVEAAVKRLLSPPMNIPEGYIPLMNLALIIKRVRIRPKGEKFERVVRRITGVYEIWDFGKYVPVSRWDPFKDEFYTDFDKSKVLKTISETTGKTLEELAEEIQRRKTVLEWMMLKNIRHYRDVATVFRKYFAHPETLYSRAKEEVAVTEKSG